MDFERPHAAFEAKLGADQGADDLAEGLTALPLPAL